MLYVLFDRVLLHHVEKVRTKNAQVIKLDKIDVKVK